MPRPGRLVCSPSHLRLRRRIGYPTQSYHRSGRELSSTFRANHRQDRTFRHSRRRAASWPPRAVTMTETNRPALGVELMGEELPLVLFPQRLRELCEIVKVHQLSSFSFGAARVIPDGLSFCAKANPGRAPVLWYAAYVRAARFRQMVAGQKNASRQCVPFMQAPRDTSLCTVSPALTRAPTHNYAVFG
jgi:hypothetical protein